MRQGINIRGSFGKSVLTLLSGTALAQLIPLMISPLLTRIYDPVQFGQLALLMAVLNPLCVIASGKYELTVMLPKDEQNAHRIVTLSVFIGMILSAVLGISAYLGVDIINALFGIDFHPSFFYLLPTGLFMMGIWQPANYYFMRKEEYRKMSVNKVVQMAAISLLSLAFGYWGIEDGLMFGYILGWTALAFMTLYQLKQIGFRFTFSDFNGMKEMASRYKDYPVYNLLPSFLNTLALSVPVFILTSKFSQEDTGYFNLCRQILFIPSSFLATSIAQVYFQRVARNRQIAVPLRRDFLSLLKVLGLIALLIFITLITAGPDLFAFVFGNEWRLSGDFSRILALSICMQFVVIPISFSLPAIEKIRHTSLWQVIYFSSVAALFFFPYSEVESFLWSLTILEFVAYAIYLFWIYRLLVRHDREKMNSAA
ncbi:MAG: hypothetical protein DWQ44_07825 [Bacteroidetes bacterium]|nr:MAG: hypothetical protein DWQ33_06975 [Bacteroidota bacterium]REJ99672.1 MAG: hypothetical protein DWQ39_12125 [Bacteroidota bacterium]REK33905.1 MAG: hypothetical protein DWQ44_07825 [Bacteroidota bacterium]REK47670.1 MAG: hypothetical protein DWQ48_11860 [Bacteroidota bacterium]